jgi:hypothetical protein
MELKMPELPKVQEQPKATSVPVGTPNKGKRMANVLEVVLRPSKVATPAPPKVSKDKADQPKMIAIVDISSDLDKAGPSEPIPSKEKSGSLPKKWQCHHPKWRHLKILNTLFAMLRGNNWRKNKLSKCKIM